MQLRYRGSHLGLPRDFPSSLSLRLLPVEGSERNISAHRHVNRSRENLVRLRIFFFLVFARLCFTPVTSWAQKQEHSGSAHRKDRSSGMVDSVSRSDVAGSWRESGRCKLRGEWRSSETDAQADLSKWPLGFPVASDQVCGRANTVDHGRKSGRACPQIFFAGRPLQCCQCACGSLIRRRALLNHDLTCFARGVNPQCAGRTRKRNPALLKASATCRAVGTAEIWPASSNTLTI